jgi:hypothetical protein
MRTFGWFFVCAVFMVAAVALLDSPIDAQQKGGGGGGGFGGIFGGFGGPGTAPLTLLNNKDVRKELEVSDEQLEKLPAEVLVAISKVLTDKQFKRFKQIDLQQRKNNAFKDEAVQKELNLTADQKKNIASILEDETKELAELRGKGGFSGFGKGSTEKADNIRKESKEKIYTVLSKDQRSSWRTLIGEEFKFTQPTFPGFGKDTPFGKDAKDAPKKDAPKKDAE